MAAGHGRRDRAGPITEGAVIFGLALACGFLRLRFATATTHVVNADEAVGFLMASRMMNGQDFPLLYYGQSYLGSGSLMLTAVLMTLFGDSVFVGRLTNVLLSAAITIETYFLGKLIGGRRCGYAAAIWISLGPIVLVGLGGMLFPGYLETIFMGNLFLYLVLRAPQRPEKMFGRIGLCYPLLVGLIAGLGAWCHPLFLVYMAAATLFMIGKRDLWLRALQSRERARIGGTLAAGLLVGMSPLLVANMENSTSTMDFLWKSAVVGNDSTHGSVVTGLYNAFVICTPLALGADLPWNVYRPGISVHLPQSFAMLVESLALLGGCLLWWWHDQRKLGTTDEQDHASARNPRGWVRRPARILLASAAITTTAVVLLTGQWRDMAWELPGWHPQLPMKELVRECTHPRLLIYLLYAFPLVFLLRAPDRSAGPSAVSEGKGASGSLPHSLASSMGMLLMCLVLLCSLAAFSVSPFGNARVAIRYLAPFYSSIPVLVGLALSVLDRWKSGMGWLWLSSLVAVHGVAQLRTEPAAMLQPVHYAGTTVVPDTYGALVERLLSLDCRHVYASIWLGYPLLYASHEEIKASSGTPRRFPEHDAAVEAHSHPAFLFIRSRYDEVQFRALLRRSGIRFASTDCGSFVIYTGIDVESMRTSDIWPTVLRILSWP